jgi:glycosyltransferase involved in cell wall biosynthesis
VIVPTFNRAGFIDRSLGSVLNQTHQDFEVIVVDDASTDGTEDAVKAISDPRIRYIRHQANRGPSATRNTGIMNAIGDYIAFLDSDDEWLPEKLEKQLAEFSADGTLGLVYCGWAWVRSDRSVRIVRAPNAETGWIDGYPRWFHNMVQDIVIRREVVHECVFNERIWAYENLEWLLRVMDSVRSGFVTDVLVRCHEHKSHRASDSRLRKLEGLECVLSSHEPYLRDYKKALFHLEMTAGALALEVRDARARQHLSAAVRLRPLSARTWVRFIKSAVV